MDEYFIRTEHLCCNYRDENGREAPALIDINLKIKKGEYIAVIGRNGSGKSTLAKLLNMILLPASGKIYIDGKDMTSGNLSDDEILDIRRRVGMVFQNPDNQIVATIVEEDIAFGPENLGIPTPEIRRRVDYALETVGMRGYEKHEPHRLSGGQKQRIAIAGVLAMQPECIILDEATAMLDPRGRAEVINTIELLNRERKITVIMITHHMNEAVRADRVIVLSDGRLLRDYPPRQLFSEPDFLRRQGLGVPQSVELIDELRRQGIALEGEPVTPEECAGAIMKYLKQKKAHDG
ncbi:MAG TPA: energy-coupling factor transporter ATPase [Clostridiales bacterium]|jgi:energy-coupling factor transport system ATP-binding protein|nr:energy-coupling factor transporter ATPase [Clostridiales bacterium]